MTSSSSSLLLLLLLLLLEAESFEELLGGRVTDGDLPGETPDLASPATVAASSSLQRHTRSAQQSRL